MTPPWALALVFVVAWVFRFLSTTTLLNDHYMHLAWANQVLGGDLPLRDFVDPGMPLTYLTSAVVQLLFGRGPWAEVVLSLTLLSIGATLTCYLAGRASGSLGVGLLAALVQIVIAPRLYSAPKIVLPLWALWAFWRYADRPTRRSLAGLVACTVTAFLVRHDHGAYIWAAAMVLLIAIHWPRGATRAVSYSGLVGLCLLPFLTYVQVNGGVIAYLHTGLSFTRAEYAGRRIERQPRFDLTARTPPTPAVNIRWAPTVDPAARARVEGAHRLDTPLWLRDRTWRYGILDPSPDNVRALINRPEVEDTGGIDRSRARVLGIDDTLFSRMGRSASQRGAQWLTVLLKHDNAVAWLYLLFTGLPPVVLVMLAVTWMTPSLGYDARRLPGPVAMAAASLCVATNAGLLRDPLDARLADASAVTLVLFAWVVGQARPERAVRRAGTGLPQPRAWPHSVVSLIAATLALAAGAATLLSAAEMGGLHRAIEKTRVVDGPRVMMREALRTLRDLDTQPPIDGWIASGDEQRELKQLTRYVRECTEPDDRLLVTWFAPDVYFYAERRFAAGLAFFYPGFFSSPAEEEIAMARLREQRVPIVLVERGDSEESFARDHPLLAMHLADRYSVAGEVEAAGGRRYGVLADRRATPVRTVEPWALPCFR